MSTPSLTEFLIARIAEDETIAREATSGPWRDCPMGSEGSDVQAGGHTITTARRPARCREFADAAHIARHDPARVLAECEAKRRIVAMHGIDHECPDDGTVAGWAPAGWYEAEVCPTLRLLAMPYADHSDYREGWRP